jgi:hypothetical protein
MICQQLSLSFVPRADLSSLAIVRVKVLPSDAAQVLVKDSSGL